MSSFINYSRGGVVGKSGDIQVAANTYDFTVKAFGGSTQVVVDLTGYYIKPMWAEVSSSGGFVRGSRVVLLSHLGTGSYQVDFDRDVSGCGLTSTSYYYGTSMQIEPRTGDTHGVFVTAARLQRNQRGRVLLPHRHLLTRETGTGAGRRLAGGPDPA